MYGLMAGLVLGMLFFRNRSQLKPTVIHKYCWGFDLRLQFKLSSVGKSG